MDILKVFMALLVMAFVIVSNASTTVASDAPCTLCTKGKFYCGEQLRAMGYTEVRVGVLYECDNDNNGRVYLNCGFGGCIENGDNGGFCAVDQIRGATDKRCGWFLRLNNFPVDNPDDRALYQLVNRTAVEKVQTCPRHCITWWQSAGTLSGMCIDFARHANCAIGSKHCGFEIINHSIKKHWKPNAVYECHNGSFEQRTEVDVCNDGCTACETNAGCTWKWPLTEHPKGPCRNNSIAQKPATGCGADETSTPQPRPGCPPQCCCPESQRNQKCSASCCAGRDCSTALSCQWKVWEDGRLYGTCLPPGAGEPYDPDEDD